MGYVAEVRRCSGQPGVCGGPSPALSSLPTVKDAMCMSFAPGHCSGCDTMRDAHSSEVGYSRGLNTEVVLLLTLHGAGEQCSVPAVHSSPWGMPVAPRAAVTQPHLGNARCHSSAIFRRERRDRANSMLLLVLSAEKQPHLDHRQPQSHQGTKRCLQRPLD